MVKLNTIANFSGEGGSNSAARVSQEWELPGQVLAMAEPRTCSRTLQIVPWPWGKAMWLTLKKQRRRKEKISEEGRGAGGEKKKKKEREKKERAK